MVRSFAAVVAVVGEMVHRGAMLYTVMYVCSWKECCDKSLTQQSNLFLIPRSVNIVNQKSTKTMTIPPPPPQVATQVFFSFLLHLSKFKLYTEFLRNSVNKKKNRNKEINTHNKILKRSTKKRSSSSSSSSSGSRPISSPSFWKWGILQLSCLLCVHVGQHLKLVTVVMAVGVSCFVNVSSTFSVIIAQIGPFARSWSKDSGQVKSRDAAGERKNTQHGMLTWKRN